MMQELNPLNPPGFYKPLSCLYVLFIRYMLIELWVRVAAGGFADASRTLGGRP